MSLGVLPIVWLWVVFSILLGNLVFFSVQTSHTALHKLSEGKGHGVSILKISINYILEGNGKIIHHVSIYNAPTTSVTEQPKYLRSLKVEKVTLGYFRGRIGFGSLCLPVPLINCPSKFK